MRSRSVSADSFLVRATHLGHADAETTTFMVRLYSVDREEDVKFDVCGAKSTAVSIEIILYHLQTFAGPMGRVLASTADTWHTGGHEVFPGDTFATQRAHFITACVTQTVASVPPNAGAMTAEATIAAATAATV